MYGLGGRQYFSSQQGNSSLALCFLASLIELRKEMGNPYERELMIHLYAFCKCSASCM